MPWKIQVYNVGKQPEFLRIVDGNGKYADAVFKNADDVHTARSVYELVRRDTAFVDARIVWVPIHATG